MAMRDYNAAHRGARLLRAQRENGWYAIEERVIAAVRSTPRGGWPLDVDDPDPVGNSGRIRVSDRVLKTLLSRALADDADYVVTHIGVDSEDGVVHRISVELTGRYMAQLPAASQRVIGRCRAVVADVIGHRPDVTVDVAVSDVHG